MNCQHRKKVFLHPSSDIGLGIYKCLLCKKRFEQLTELEDFKQAKEMVQKDLEALK